MTTLTNVAATAGDLARRGVAFAMPIAQAAARHDVDPVLLAAVAAQETGGPGADAGRNIVGDGGHGRGVFQIDDRWHAFARSDQAMNPSANADYAAGLLARLLHKFRGDAHRALSAYNAGAPDATGTVTDWGGGRRLGYADSVMRHYRRLGGCCEHGTTPLASTATRLTEELLAEAPSALQSIGRLGKFAATQEKHDRYVAPEAPWAALLDPDASTEEHV